ncbi:hypothetical protein A176_006875 [Myxococcus hansupus]|uniref:Knr4/Smi1-like domain-containing protein n=1 Tax=Pseudomyxococcus hansupus TaxID=1297742 RepID=A0A0H4X7P1_9BACT|nr:hypothetical protein [Myxococcus hansupus]AKQ69963.1 hypothetical protein A176_006875 [Myxococcus hansupus]
MSTISKCMEVLSGAEHLTVKKRAAIESSALVEAVTPHFGTIEWAPPASYREALASGLSAVTRHLVSVGMNQGFWLYDADNLGTVNEDLVHMPEGVSFDEGVDLSTNHLVGFAEAGGEAVWCFDVSAPGADGEYPVYYHHQDTPRAKVRATGAWNEPQDETPDFESFSQWLETMTVALTAEEPPEWLERLGEPGLTFVESRRTL